MSIARLAAAGVVGTVVVIVGTLDPSAARADNLWLHACSYYGNTAPAFLVPPSGFSTNGSASSWQGSDSCTTNPTQEGSLQIDTQSNIDSNRYGLWQTISPYGINIDSAWTPGCSGYCDRQYRGPLINCYLGQDDYQAYFQWNWGGSSSQQQRIVNNDGGTCPYSNGLANGTPINRSFPPTHEFGFSASCENNGNQCSKLGPTLYVRGLQVGATEGSSPSLLALGSSNLFYQGGRWVRAGGWPISLRVSDPSGVCNMGASLNGSWIQGPATTPNYAYWDQCDPAAEGNDPSPQDWSDAPTIDTTNYGDGTQLQLSYAAVNAAGIWSNSPTSTSSVDNAPVGLVLSGPSDAALNAGTQYLTATAAAGLSGVGAITCSTDGGQWTARHLNGGGAQTATAEVPVSGLGAHIVKCYASNNAIDVSGQDAASPTQTWSLKIGEPTVAALSFSRVGRRCHLARRRIHARKHTKVERVLVCHTVTRTRTSERVAYGRPVTVNGWVSVLEGPAVGHEQVAIMTAPDNGSYAWRRAAVTTTAADGTFRAVLRPGPSRLIEAVYGGGPLTEAATSRVARLVVPAKIELGPLPAHVPWGGVLVIRGRVLGGFIPPEQILQIRSGVGEHLQVIGNPNIRRDGRFVIRLAATGSGGALQTQIQISTLRETNYPYARGYSRRVSITIG